MSGSCPSCGVALVLVRGVPLCPDSACPYLPAGVPRNGGAPPSVHPGDRYGRLVVLGQAETHADPSGRTHRSYVCRCSCGVEKVVPGKDLRSRHSRSCGYLKRAVDAERLAALRLTHGHRPGSGPSPTYTSWHAMKQRCMNPKAKSWHDYGARGITICERWRDSFGAFLADLGERPEGMTLGRFGDTGNYELGNVAWMTPAEHGAEQRWKRARRKVA